MEYQFYHQNNTFKHFLKNRKLFKYDIFYETDGVTIINKYILKINFILVFKLI